MILLEAHKNLLLSFKIRRKNPIWIILVFIQTQSYNVVFNTILWRKGPRKAKVFIGPWKSLCGLGYLLISKRNWSHCFLLIFHSRIFLLWIQKHAPIQQRKQGALERLLGPTELGLNPSVILGKFLNFSWYQFYKIDWLIHLFSSDLKAYNVAATVCRVVIFRGL